jgi:hypothetical protein
MSVLSINDISCYLMSCNHEQGGDWNTKVVSTYATGGAGTSTTIRADNRKTGGSFDCYRSTVTFDTSSIPANATIHSAIFSMLRGYERIEQGNGYCYICPVSATGTNTSYYNRTYFGTAITYLTLTTSDNVNTLWQPEVKTAIVKAGTTILGFRLWHDVYNSAPGNDGQANISNGSNPTLTITYTTPPVVTTGVATDLQPISATLAGNVTDAGGGTVSTRGVCWATTENPTTSDSKTATTGTTGEYTVSATGLLPGTLYYARAYVTTENSTTYGDNVTFRTPGGAILFNLL